MVFAFTSNPSNAFEYDDFVHGP